MFCLVKQFFIENKTQGSREFFVTTVIMAPGACGRGVPCCSTLHPVAPVARVAKFLRVRTLGVWVLKGVSGLGVQRFMCLGE